MRIRGDPRVHSRIGSCAGMDDVSRNGQAVRMGGRSGQAGVGGEHFKPEGAPGYAGLLQGMQEPCRKGASDSILTLSLASGIAR